MEPEVLQLKRYLLGDLAEEQRGEYDLRILRDDEFGITVEFAEEDLIEQYLDHELTKNEMQKFENHFLSSPSRIQQFEVSRQLRHYAHDELARAIPDGKYLFPKVRNLFSGIWAPVYAIALLILIGAAAIYFWGGRRVEYQELQSQYLAENTRDFTNLEEFKDFKNIELLPGSPRSTGVKVLSAGETGESIFVRLLLPTEVKDRNDLKAEVIRENRVLMAFDALNVYETNSGKEVRLLLPSKIFKKGNYRIEVSPAGASKSAINYVLTVD
jgi:hypothetical protein